MTTLTQKIYNLNGELLYTVTHIYAKTGHFERDGFKQGWHIQLGTNDSANNYTEIDDGITHEIPDVLPDITIDDTPDEEDLNEEIDDSDALDEILEVLNQ